MLTAKTVGLNVLLSTLKLNGLLYGLSLKPCTLGAIIPGAHSLWTEVFDLHARPACAQSAANSASMLLGLTTTYAGQRCGTPDFVAELLAFLLRRGLLLLARFVVFFLSASHSHTDKETCECRNGQNVARASDRLKQQGPPKPSSRIRSRVT